MLTGTTEVKKSPFSRTAAHIFVSPGDAPGAITLNVVWMEREFDAYKLSRSMYPSIFNSFPVIRNARWKDNSMLAKPLAAILSELYDA